jgi:hypothetical protein
VVCDGVLVIERLVLPSMATQIIDALSLMSGSGVSLDAVAVLLTQLSTELATVAVTVKVCEAPASSESIVHVTVPVA